MPHNLISRNAVDLLRLSESERQELEAYLLRENHKRQQAKPSGRAAPRFHYKSISPTIVELPSNTGDPQSYIVLAKDLSATGFAFIHGTFVYPAAQCTVMLCTADNERLLVSGKVIRCELIKGRAHEVAVCFDEPIDPRNFVGGAVKDETPAGAAAKHPNPPGDARLQIIVAELGALASQRDCPPAVRRKIQQLAQLVAGQLAGLHEQAVLEAGKSAAANAVKKAA